LKQESDVKMQEPTADHARCLHHAEALIQHNMKHIMSDLHADEAFAALPHVCMPARKRLSGHATPTP